MIKTHLFIPLFSKFISKTRRGIRLSRSGQRIKPQTITNYDCCKKLLQNWEVQRAAPLLLLEYRGRNRTEYNRVKKHYQNFYKDFRYFMVFKENYSDNYVGQNIKILRSFFCWLNDVCFIETGNFYKSFYLVKEDVPILTLSVEQLRFLMFDKEFEQRLPPHLQVAKNVFVFGCVVGLRYSDLCLVKRIHIQHRNGYSFLNINSKKTDTATSVKLPTVAIAIINKYKCKGGYLLPTTSLSQFNYNLKKMALLAGWIFPVAHQRAKDGQRRVQTAIQTKRFCDLISSHTMRRTAITTMLTSGMPEYVVRKISGHSNDSRAFFRYVNLAQGIMDKEIDKMHAHFL